MALSVVENSVLQEDDEVADMAMQALRDTDHSGMGGDAFDQSGEDGSWMLPLLKRHVDPLFGRIISAVTNRDIVPVPLRIHEARFNQMRIVDRVDSALSAIPDSYHRNGSGAAGGGGVCEGLQGNGKEKSKTKGKGKNKNAVNQHQMQPAGQKTRGAFGNITQASNQTFFGSSISTPKAAIVNNGLEKLFKLQSNGKR